MAILLWACSGGTGPDAAAPCAINLQTQEVSVVDPGPGTGAHACAVPDGDGGVRVAYVREDTGGLWLASGDGMGWDREPILAGEARVDATWFGRSVALAALPSGGLLVAFYDADQRILKSAFREAAGSWSLGVIDPQEGAGLDVSMAVAEDGRAHLAYLDLLNGDLRYAVGKPGDWSLDTIDTEGITGNDPSLALEGDTVHASYYSCGELTPSGCTGQLRYARGGPGNFQVEVVDQGDDSGWYTALGIDSKGTSHVSYFSHGSGALKYAFRMDGAWALEVVEGGPGAGEYGALALVDDRVFIVYTVRNQDGIRVAERLPTGAWHKVALEGSGEGTYGALVRPLECGLACAWHDEGADVLRFARFAVD